MSEFDVARIKSMFEKGPKNEASTPKLRTQERRRTIATYGLSPGIHAQKKVTARNNQKQVRVAPIPGSKKDAAKMDVEETKSDKTIKPSPSNDVKAQPEMNSPTRRMTMPTSYSFLPPKANKNVITAKKPGLKVNWDVKDKDSGPKSKSIPNKTLINDSNRNLKHKDKDSSPKAKIERGTRTIQPEVKANQKVEDSSPKSKSERGTRSIKPTFSGKRSFFDRQGSTASDPTRNVIEKPKTRANTTSTKKGQKPEPSKRASFKTDTKPNITRKDSRKSPRKSPTTTQNKVSKFAYASVINKDKRASFAATGYADQKKSNDAGQSSLSPYPLRRQSLSDLPLPEHESVDIDDFHRSHSHNIQWDGTSEGVASLKKGVTRDKDMNLLKDRKTVTSMRQKFSSSQSTPIHCNTSNRVKEMKDVAEPPPPPIQEDSFDQQTTDGSEIIEEVTVVSEYTSSSVRNEEEDEEESEDDYSYEEVTATEADDFTETDSFMLSSVGMETASRVSYTPSLKSQRRVVVDFQNMEMTESKMKEKHLKVVKDLEMLMTKSANQPETKVQRTIKDKMLDSLLHTNKSMVPEGVRQTLLQADLTIHEVSEIVAHMNMCEETKSPIRWDLIKAIVFPDGIDDETNNAFEEAMKQQGGSKSNLPPISPSRMLSKKGQAATPTGTLGGAAAQELFRNQYDLSKDDMADIVAHLTLCEETGTEVRWDLIYQIVYPEDEMGAEDSQTDPGSMMFEAFDDNESVTSWYSIYPEKSECGSEITFNIDEDDEAGSLPRIKTPKESGDDAGGVAGQLSPGQTQRGISDNSELANKNDDQLLRKRIQQLQLASGGKAFQVHRRKKGA